MSSPRPDAAARDVSAQDDGPATGGAHRARRHLVALLLLAALGVLVLASLGAAAERGPLAVADQERSAGPEAEQTLSSEYSEPDWSVYTVPPREPDSGAPRFVTPVLVAIAATAAGLLLLWLVLRVRALTAPGPEEAAEAPEDPLTVEDARIALEDARERLSTAVDAQDAVIAAWLALEQAIARAGVRRAPAQTTLEFVVAVLGTLPLDHRALDRLAHLYRRALFDDRPLGEEDRVDARDQLERLSSRLAELGR